MKNNTTGKFTGNIRDIFAYLLATYGKISPIYLDNFEKEVTEIHYDPVNPVDNIFNKIENLPKHRDMVGCPYSHPQAIYKAYNILNKTGNFRDSINFWNGLPLIHKMWTAFKNNFADPIKKSLTTDN